MEYRNLGNSGLKVSAISLGSWLTLGQSVEQKTTDEIVRAAIDAGVNFLDTADIYGQGAAEFSLGKTITSYRRQDLVIATKAYWPMSGNINDRGLSRKHLFESCEGSLKRLGIDYLDLYQCHRYDEDTPLVETVRAMGDLIAQGKILYWGTSMWTAEQLRNACEIADELHVPRPTSEQPRYNLLDREIEREVLPTCTELGIGLIVWSPLAQGFLTNKYQPGLPPPPGTRGADAEAGQWLQEDLGNPDSFRIVAHLQEAANQHRIPLPRLALAWCLRQPTVASAIVGATRAAQVTQNAAAAEMTWSLEMESSIEAALTTTEVI